MQGESSSSTFTDNDMNNIPAATVSSDCFNRHTSVLSFSGNQPNSSAQPHSNLTMLSSKVSGTSNDVNEDNNLINSPPQMTKIRIQNLPSELEDDDHNEDRPPMSVVVVTAPTATARTTAATSPTAMQDRHSSSSFSPFASPFRLQPRSTFSIVSSGGRGDSVRGRKRSAQSMSVSANQAARDSLLISSKPHPPAPLKKPPPPPQEVLQGAAGHTNRDEYSSSAVAETPPKQQPQCTPSRTPPRNRRGLMGNTVVNFQCLSLQSPKRKDPPHAMTSPPPLSFATSPPANQHHHHHHHHHGAINSNTASSSSSSSQHSRLSGGKPPPSAIVSSSVGSHSNHTLPPRSSFTPVYNAASPGGCSLRSCGSASIGSNTRMQSSVMAAGAAAFSPSAGGGGGSTKSSPKLAPLTVLKDQGSTLLPARENHARLPPLPGGGMNSLWLSLESSSDNGMEEDQEKMPARPSSKQKDNHEEPRMLPPRTVHCRRPSSDSISTVQNSVLSPLGGSIMSSQESPSPSGSAGAFGTPAALAPKPRTPRSNKQARLDDFASPSQRTPRTPQTPLPRVTLTPRSTGSRRNGLGNPLPRFPDPSDVEMDVTSPFLSSAATASLRNASHARHRAVRSATPKTATTPGEEESGKRERGAIRSLFPESSNSLALSADGSANEDCNKPAAVSSSAAAGVATGHEGKAPLPVLDLSRRLGGVQSGGEQSPVIFRDYDGLFMGIQTQSLLTSSRTGGFLHSMMEEGGTKGDMESVSDIDDHEGFILASPSAIEEERLASFQPARQRRRRSIEQYSAGPSCPSPGASNTNLVGMNYVTSNTSLFGMDIAHPPESSSNGWVSSSNGECRDLLLAGNDSSTPLAAASLTKGHSTAPAISYHENQNMKRRKSDGSFASIGLALEGHGGDGGRDLVTPPPMPTPQTPPPLSPKEGLCMHGPQNHSVCIAGADQRSVTMAIARMAFESYCHPESSPVS